MSKKKRRRAPAVKAVMPALKTTQDLLAGMPGYTSYLKVTKIALAGCVACIAAALLLRINMPGLEPLALFLNMLSYVLVGSALFLWLVRLRPLRKRAASLAEEQNALLREQIPSGCTAPAPVTGTSSGKASLFCWPKKDNGPKNTRIPQSPEYLRYRLRWRILLMAAAVLIIGANMALSLFEGSGGVALVIQVSAFIPLAGAVYVYQQHLRPLKREWETRHPQDKGSKG
jgi:hypothetical protein